MLPQDSLNQFPCALTSCLCAHTREGRRQHDQADWSHTNSSLIFYNKTAFDLTVLQTFQANTKSLRSSGVGWRLVTTSKAICSFVCVVQGLVLKASVAFSSGSRLLSIPPVAIREDLFSLTGAQSLFCKFGAIRTPANCW